MKEYDAREVARLLQELDATVKEFEWFRSNRWVLRTSNGNDYIHIKPPLRRAIYQYFRDEIDFYREHLKQKGVILDEEMGHETEEDS